jgi:hypothetical protein
MGGQLLQASEGSWLKLCYAFAVATKEFARRQVSFRETRSKTGGRAGYISLSLAEEVGES